MLELQVNVTTPDCGDGEAYLHRIPADTDMGELFKAIRLLYPESTGVWVGMPEEYDV